MIELFSYSFLNHAMLAAVISSISCGIIGTYVVTKRLVFITGGITHASFGGLGIAYFFGLSPILGAAIFGGLSALGVQYLSYGYKVRNDSAIAMAWSFGMALGIIFIFITPGYAPNLMSYLFGSILTVTSSDLIVMFILMLIITGFFAIYYHPIHFIAFDERFAKANGIATKTFSYFLILLVAITAVLFIKVAGIILVLSLLTIPQNTAMLFTKQFKNIIFLAIIFGLIGSIGGLALAYWLDIPSGAAIIFTLFMEFLLASAINRIRRYSRI